MTLRSGNPFSGSPLNPAINVNLTGLTTHDDIVGDAISRNGVEIKAFLGL